jgi:hypothetical protein
VPVALEALYVAEESYGARPVSGFADAPGRRDDIVAYADNSNLVTKGQGAIVAMAMLRSCQYVNKLWRGISDEIYDAMGKSRLRTLDLLIPFDLSS